MKFLSAMVTAASLLQVLGASAQNTAQVSIPANQPGAVVSSNLFGIFFEEINFAGEGGIYAEMVRNRSFKNSANPDYWTLVTGGTATGTMAVDFSHPLNTNKPCSLKLTMASGTGSVGAANSGFWGMSLQADMTYNLSFYALGANGFAGPVGVQLQNASGSKVYAQASFGGLSAAWQKFTAALVSSGTDTNARIVLSLTKPGTVWLDEVSLFPQATFNNRTNGLQAELANRLAALHPSFMRYPGGNFIEGNFLTNAVRWKKTIGDPALRPGHENDAWGYWSTDGFGLPEYLQFCEDLDMAPLYGINCGLALGWNGATNNTVPINQLGPWIQDALDLIQYANGATNTTWGAQRAANGHPAPYQLQYLEIGNENSGSYYDERYGLFYHAIKSEYPSMHLIANDQGSIPTSAPVEIQDEHYYLDPATFITYATKYDSYSRSGPRVFVGEYAVTAGTGPYGSLAGALGEAAFMTGLERNSDVVLLASYAPLFANVNGMQWSPNLINYDSAREVFGTPSYYVQEMFGQNRGDAVLPATVVVATNLANAGIHGAIGLGSWNTSVQYTNIVVTSNGVTLYQSDFVNQGTTGWNVFGGTWSATNGLYQQTAQVPDCYATAGNTNWANYTLTVQARKTGGAEGFLILFNLLDGSDWTWWNLGGWGNTLDGIEQMVGGNKTTYAQVPQFIATNTWYYVRIVVTGPRAQCYLGTNALQAATNLVQDVTLPILAGGFLVSSTYAKAAGQVIIKAVNAYSSPLATSFNLTGVEAIAPNAALIQLTSGSGADANSLAEPTLVFPVTNTIPNSATNFTLTLPANSLSILRLTASGVQTYTNLKLQVASPIYTTQVVAATVWAQQSGTWFNLTSNANHALTWASANTNIATVDANGIVTGVGSGTTSIQATYASLGLSATQSVQVVYVPVSLVHRYSFSETSGSTVADSVGGPAWNGTLPRGGTWGGGQLTFSAAAQQYLNLPGGILENDSAATLEMWVPSISGATTSPPFVYLFAFGNTDAAGNGYDYIFFNPNLARTAISAADPGFNGEQGGNLAASLGVASNLHLTWVFDCPKAAIRAYTNGVLAATFTGLTETLSAVGNEFAYVGRSLYANDAYLNWTLDEFRIYNGALSAAEIAATQVLGPGQLLSAASPALNASAAGGNLILAWPVASAGFTVMSTTNLLGGTWSPVSVTPQMVANQWQVVLPIEASAPSAQFYQLSK